MTTLVSNNFGKTRFKKHLNLFPTILKNKQVYNNIWFEWVWVVMVTLSDLTNELIFSSNDNSIQWFKIYNAQSFLVDNMWKCAENLCMKMYNSLSLIFENSENMIGRGT